MLLAEAYTISDKSNEALQMYEELLDARESENESTKDIYRKMAPLYQQLEDYQKAATCLQKVID